MQLSGVYKITNILNGDFYIGSSKNCRKRFNKHYQNARIGGSDSNERFYDAIKQFGEENFSFQMVEQCEPIRELLLEREQHYIDTLKPHYNTQLTAYPSWNASMKTGPRLDETKAKISASHKVSEARQAVYEARKGYIWTDEQREQISESNKTSDAAVAYHQNRIGKSTAKSTHGEYGITWRNDSGKWCVKIRNKKYGNFANFADAIVRRDAVMIELAEAA